MQLPMLDWTHKQRYARKGIRYRGIFRVMQISNHYPAKTQAEIQQTVQPVFNMEKGRKTEMMMNDDDYMFCGKLLGLNFSTFLLLPYVIVKCS